MFAVVQTPLKAQSPLPDTAPSELPDRIPPALFHKMLSSVKVVGAPGLAWKNQKVVTVAFQGGSDPLYALIESTAQEWKRVGGQLDLSFRDEQGRYRHWTNADTLRAANIRIAFNEGEYGGYWSLLGVLAKNVEPNQPTMNFEGFAKTLQRYFDGQNASEWLTTYEHTTILHEFGHALGLGHEHFHPQCQRDLNIGAIIRLLSDEQHWSEEVSRFQMEAEYFAKIVREGSPQDARVVITRDVDQRSVMLYLFPDQYYLSGAKSVCRPIGDSGKPYPTTLSAGDKAFYLEYYRTVGRIF
jgi:hypothetical protein